MSKELEALYKLGQIEFETGDYMNDYGYMMRVENTEIYEILENALTPPTEQEVCEHLNETFGLKGKNTNLHFIYDKESREFRMVSQGQVYRYISTKRQSEDSIEFTDLDIDDIVILGQFYKGVEELK